MALNINGNPETPVSIDCQDPAEETPLFKISHQTLSDLLQENDGNSLQLFGGIQGIMAALETNAETGITGDAGDLHRRRKAFGSNLYVEEQPPLNTVVDMAAFVRLSQKYLKDTTIILLLCCALLSAAIEIRRNGGVVEGVLIDGAINFSAVSFVLFFGLVCTQIRSVRRTRSMMKKKKLAAAVCVIRCGNMLRISDSEVVAGDIVCLQAGNHIPADGLLIHGNLSFKLDDEEEGNFKQNPCLFSGAKVKTGRGRMLVVSVGNNTERNRLMRSVMSSKNDYNQESRLQICIDKTNSRLERVLMSLTLFILVLQLFRCFLSDPDKCDDTKGVKNSVEGLMHEWTKLMKKQVGVKRSGLITFLSVLIFALRDGLPLGIFVTFVYAKRKMTPYGTIVRNLSACATIGSTYAICMGVITDDLALNPSEMADLWIGFDFIKDVSVELLPPQVLQLLQDGISTYVSCSDSHRSNPISYWAYHFLGEPNKKNEESVVHIHCNGDETELEKFLSSCSHFVNRDGTVETLGEDRKDSLTKQFQQIASNKDHQVFAFAYAYEQVIQDKDDDDDRETLKPSKHGLTFLALVSLKNPYPPEMRRTIQDFRDSGVSIKLAVETDIAAARIVAIYSGILRREEDSEGAVIEASEFRKRNEEERMKTIENIHVIANASPVEKLQFVQCLKQKNKVVGFTSSCTRDSPTLKQADVGVFMGGDNDFSSEDSDIIVLNKNVSTMYNVVQLGRCVKESVKRFVQLQLSLNIAAFTVNFISAIVKKEGQLILEFQVLWINLAMDVLGALALAIIIVDCSTRVSHTCAINGEDDQPIMTRAMWRNIVVQSSFQVAILMTVEVKLGRVLFEKSDASMLKTMINGYYGFSQVFSLIGATVMLKKKKKNGVFEGFLVNRKFVLILCIVGSIAFLEVGLVDIMAIVAHWGRLSSKQWCICIGIAAVSMPVTNLFSVYIA